MEVNLFNSKLSLEERALEESIAFYLCFVYNYHSHDKPFGGAFDYIGEA